MIRLERLYVRPLDGERLLLVEKLAPERHYLAERHAKAVLDREKVVQIAEEIGEPRVRKHHLDEAGILALVEVLEQLPDRLLVLVNVAFRDADLRLRRRDLFVEPREREGDGPDLEVQLRDLGVQPIDLRLQGRALFLVACDRLLVLRYLALELGKLRFKHLALFLLLPRALRRVIQRRRDRAEDERDECHENEAGFDDAKKRHAGRARIVQIHARRERRE